MATLILTPDEMANGNLENDAELGGVLTVTGRPIVDYFEGQTPPIDWSNATVHIEIPDSSVVDGEDYDGDGAPDQVIGTGTPIESFRIDLDNDGTFDYEVVAQNPGESIELNTQTGSNVGELNGTFSIVDLDTGISTPISGGNIFISTDGPFPEAPGQKDIINEGSDELDVDGIVCFLRGTEIATPDGLRPVQDLRVGDLVLTVDHGAQPIRWIGSRKLSSLSLFTDPSHRPIRIPADALGDGIPARDLLVSPQHRILVCSTIAKRMFGSEEILLPAKKLLGVSGISQAEGTAVEYFHFLLDRHELVWANGAMAESLLPGSMAFRALTQRQRDEICRILPGLQASDHDVEPARQIVANRRLGRLLERHVKNGMPLASSHLAAPVPRV